MVELPFCDLSGSNFKSLDVSGHGGVRTCELEFENGPFIYINSALGAGADTAPFLRQEEFKGRFVGYDDLKKMLDVLASGKFARPWLYERLSADARRIRRIVPFESAEIVGYVVEREPDTLQAEIWNSTKDRLAVLTTKRDGESHLWETLASWRWQERPGFPIEQREHGKLRVTGVSGDRVR